MYSLNHVGIAVFDVLAAAEEYRRLGFCVSQVEEQKEHGVRVVFVQLENTCIELLEPLGEHSPIRQFLEKKGPGVHHIALGVQNLDRCLSGFLTQQIPLIDTAPRLGAHEHRVAFMHPKATSSRVLFEFCEPTQALLPGTNE